MDIELRINKQNVYTEVAKTTSYTGAKMTDEDAYDRIFTTAEDAEMLDKFWSESKIAICGNLAKLLHAEDETNGTWRLILNVSSAFDSNLRDSMEQSLFSFFVANITAKWYVFTNREDVTTYVNEAVAYVDDIKKKAYNKKKPIRPKF
jgi:hypothetical protein